MDLPFLQDVEARGRVRVRTGTKPNGEFEESVFDIVARGEQARALNRLGARAKVKITGHLQYHAWETAQGTTHTKVEVFVDGVK